jgi:hypothetical protein
MALSSMSTVLIPQHEATSGNGAKTSPQTVSMFKHFLHHLSSPGVALWSYGAGVLDFHFTPSLLNLANQHIEALQNVHRLETADRACLAVLIHHLLVRLCSYDCGDVTRAQETIYVHLFRGQERVQRRGQQLVCRKYQEVFQTLLPGQVKGRGYGRYSGLEADAKHDYHSIFVLASQF